MANLTSLTLIEEIKARLETLYNCQITVIVNGGFDFALKVENDNLTVKQELAKTHLIGRQLRKFYQFKRVDNFKNITYVYEA